VAGSPDVRVELLGGFRVIREGRMAARVPSARQQEVIACLALHGRGSPVSRQRVAGSLWPDSTDGQALTNLRRELHHLREEWPELDAMIEAGSRTLMWTGPVDVAAFDAAAARGLAGTRDALTEAARLYIGDVLPDCDSEWLEPERSRLREQAMAVLTELVGQLERESKFADAITYATHLLRLDPLREPVWCALMRSHAGRGDRAAALEAYQQCASILKQELGIQPGAATRLLHREILDADAPAPSASPPHQATTYPLLGRETEWRALLREWREAERGARLLLVRGEAGIGKSRLAEEFVHWCRTRPARPTAAEQGGVKVLTARCYAGEGRLAYAPLAAWLSGDALKPVLATLDAPALSDVARLHPASLATRPEVPPPDGPLDRWQQLRFFEALAQTFRSAAPIALVLDDLQWADADTIEWLQYFLRSTSNAHCLVVATVRAEEEQDNPPVERLLRQLAQHETLTVIQLGPLDEAATAQLADAVAEHPLDAAAAARTFRATEGHPLFIIERGRIAMGAGGATPGDNALSRVQSVVAARLALLSPAARAAAEVAAAIGRDFSVDLLARAIDLDEATLVGAVDELWRRQIVRGQPDGRWDFSHDRIREVAYSGLGPARAPLVHRRIAAAMEAMFAERLDEVSAAVAMHLDRGGQPARAIPFLERAAAVALRMSAAEESIRCLSDALRLLDSLPATPERRARELELRSSLSVALNASRGYADPAIEANLDRVLSLTSDGTGAAVPVRWLWVAFTLRFMLGDLRATRAISEQALAYSERDPSCRCEAHHAMGGTLISAGEIVAACRHFEIALASYDEQHPQESALGSDLGVFAHAWYSHALWLRGDEAAALIHASNALALAERRDHPYSETLALAYAALLHQLRGDRDHLVECAERAVTYTGRYGIGYYGDWARVLLGWARGQDHPDEGVAAITAALAQMDGRRAQARRPYYLSLLADTQRLAGNRDAAATIVDTAIDMALQRSDVWWLPALYLQKSALAPRALRADLVQRALTLARAHGSRGLEQRILSEAGD